MTKAVIHFLEYVFGELLCGIFLVKNLRCEYF